MSAKKLIVTSGTRKRAIARATIKPGKGKIRVNKAFIEHFEPKLSKMKLLEPIMLAGEMVNSVDVSIIVKGGGVNAQAEAARLALARALVAYSKSEKLKQKFLQYDRHLVVADSRRKEECKPNDSKARAKRQKSYR